MNASTICFLLVSLAVFCNGSSILYDVQVSEVVDGKEINTEESEIFIEERFLTPQPPTIDMHYEEKVEEEIEAFLGRTSFNLSDIQYQMSFGKKEGLIPEEHQSFQISFGIGLGGSTVWGDWSCCRKVVNVQSRQRMIQAPKLELEFKRCNIHNCDASKCKDSSEVCKHFIATMGRDLCLPTNRMSAFMSQNCPLTCKFCDPSPPPPLPSQPKPMLLQMERGGIPWWMTKPTTPVPWWQTRKSTTTAEAPSINSNLVKVTIFFSRQLFGFTSYKFLIDESEPPRFPWKRVSESGSELSFFYLYKEQTRFYSLPLRFCSVVDPLSRLEKWAITRRNCLQGWTEEFILYASRYRSRSSSIYYVGNSGPPRYTSRVSSKYPSENYAQNPFIFYGPKSENTLPTSPPTATTPWWQTIRQTQPTSTTPWWQATSKMQTPTTPWWQASITPRSITTQGSRSGSRPPYPVTQPNQPFSVSIFNQNCLTAHNFFRAVHNVPALIWSPELARTSQSWADQLKRIAPNRPDKLQLPHLRTRNWPHSDSGAGYRNRGDGENIAWDMSNDGSPIEESVMRWYSEVFYYDRNNPTVSPATNKPVGHLTQMLWKDTTHLGCGVASTQIQQNRYTLLSTWTVSHYSPGGNVRYSNNPSKTKQLYDEQVPDIESGACITNSGSCTNGNQCMAFGPSRGTCSCNGGRASCQSAGGCIAWCENRSRTNPWKEECNGRSTCSCGAQGAECA